MAASNISSIPQSVPQITIVGLGSGDPDQLTMGVWRRLQGAKRIFVRTAEHPTLSMLTDNGMAFESLSQVDEYVNGETAIPVFSLVKMKIGQWEQEDPAVAEDIANGNIILKPKNNWNALELAMNNAAK